MNEKKTVSLSPIERFLSGFSLQTSTHLFSFKFTVLDCNQCSLGVSFRSKGYKPWKKANKQKIAGNQQKMSQKHTIRFKKRKQQMSKEKHSPGAAHVSTHRLYWRTGSTIDRNCIWEDLQDITTWSRFGDISQHQSVLFQFRINRSHHPICNAKTLNDKQFKGKLDYFI